MNSPRKHIHLGTRLEAADKVRRGEISAADAARALGVSEGDVLEWVASGERPVSFDDVLVSPDAQRLTRRAQRLVALIAEADSAIRALTQRSRRDNAPRPRAPSSTPRNLDESHK